VAREQVGVAVVVALDNLLARPQRPAVDVDQQRPFVLLSPRWRLEEEAVDVVAVTVLVSEQLRLHRDQLLRRFGMRIGQYRLARLAAAGADQAQLLAAAEACQVRE